MGHKLWLTTTVYKLYFVLFNIYHQCTVVLRFLLPFEVAFYMYLSMQIEINLLNNWLKVCSYHARKWTIVDMKRIIKLKGLFFSPLQLYYQSFSNKMLANFTLWAPLWLIVYEKRRVSYRLKIFGIFSVFSKNFHYFFR